MHSPPNQQRRARFLGIVMGISNLIFVGAGYALASITGGPAAEVDLAVTGISVSAAPFYEMVFDDNEPTGMHEALRPDPITKVRARPLYRRTGRAGPHDAIGFRSQAVPTHVDIVTIGDSQTYGWGVPIEDNWPSQLAAQSGRDVYNMALGGWGGAQYHYIAQKAIRLSPRQIIVGLYMGNDSIETLTQVYRSDHFAAFRLPGVESLAQFHLKFERQEPITAVLPNAEIAFTPMRRWFVNRRDNPAVLTGYGMLADISIEIARYAANAGVSTMFVVIPTKETVYAPTVARHGKDPGDLFRNLVEHEALNRAELVARLRSANCKVVDATSAMQDAVAEGLQIYPTDADGHPAAAGYRVIAHAVGDALPAIAPK